MAKLTRKSLDEFRNSLKKEFNQRNTAGKTKIIIGMGTCGLAAGAHETHAAFLEELEIQKITDAEVTGTGCMGLCHVEPTVEIIVPGMPSIVYGNVNGEIARKIVRKHIQGKILINDHIFDKPAMDIVESLGRN